MKRLVFFFILLSCQPIEVIEPVVFDNDQLSNISINARNIEIKQTYESKFTDPYIDYSLKYPPVERLKSWIQTNVNLFGKKNQLKIKSSLAKKAFVSLAILSNFFKKFFTNSLVFII